MSQLRGAALVAAVDLKRRLRNRSLLVQAFLGPIALATIISLAFGSGMSIDAKVGVVDEDGSAPTRAFAEGLVDASGDGLEFVAVDGAGDARRMIDDGDLGTAVVMPAGFADSLAVGPGSARLAGGDGSTDSDGSSGPAAVEALTDDDSPIASSVARSVAETFTARAEAGRLAAATTVSSGGQLPSMDDLAGLELPVSVRTRSSGDEVSPAAYFGPSMGLLFLFLSVGLVARSLLDEKRRHVLDRMRVSPIRPSAILAGKCASTVVLGVLSLAVIWLVTAVALGADWGDPLGVVLLIVTSALAVAGIAGVVAAVARTDQAAESFATMVAFVLALVGGNFIPLGDLPDALRRVSLLSPNGWALQGFAELSAGGGSAGDVLPHALVLLGFGVVTSAIAAVLLPRRLESAR